MLARLQQIMTLGLLLLAASWLGYWWGTSGVVAFAGLVVVVLGYALFLALEFVALHSLNQTDPAGPALWRDLLKAWWGEVWTAPRVFCWRQPFRANAEPDYLPGNRRRGVVLVHGFVCNRGLWRPWLTHLRDGERAFVAVNLEPVFGSIDEYVSIIEAAVVRVTAATGRAPLVLCHSMGGLAVRAWLRAGRNDDRVHQVVTLGTPHGGTWLGRFSWVTNGAQMRLNGNWLATLAAAEPAQRYQRFICWYSNCDNIVFPASTATLPGADNRFVPALAHVSMVFDRQIMHTCLALLSDGEDDRQPGA